MAGSRVALLKSTSPGFVEVVVEVMVTINRNNNSESVTTIPL